jgi:hypothetical protein
MLVAACDLRRKSMRGEVEWRSEERNPELEADGEESQAAVPGDVPTRERGHFK